MKLAEEGGHVERAEPQPGRSSVTSPAGTCSSAKPQSGRSRALAEAQKVGGGLVEVGRVAGTLAHQIVRGLRGGLLPLPPLPPSEVQR